MVKTVEGRAEVHILENGESDPGAQGGLTLRSTFQGSLPGTGRSFVSRVYVPGEGGGGAAWAPTDVAELGLWLDASHNDSIVATGNDLTALNDRSSNARNFTAGNNPQTGTRTINSLNVIDCASASSHYLQNTDYIPSDPFQIIVVAVVDATTGSQDTLFRIGGTVRVAVVGGSPGNFFGIPDFSGGSNVDGVNWPGSQVGNLAIWRYVFDTATTTYKWYLNGTLLEENTTGFNGAFNTERFNFMAQHSGSNYLDGAFCEAIVMENTTEDDGQKAEGFVAHKWGAQGSLPGGHPYQSEAP